MRIEESMHFRNTDFKNTPVGPASVHYGDSGSWHEPWQEQLIQLSLDLGNERHNRISGDGGFPLAVCRGRLNTA